MTLSGKILDKNNTDLNERHLLHFLDTHNYFKWNLVVHRYLRANYDCYQKKKKRKKKKKKGVNYDLVISISRLKSIIYF